MTYNQEGCRFVRHLATEIMKLFYFRLPHANEDPDVTTAWCEQLITISEKVKNQRYFKIIRNKKVFGKKFTQLCTLFAGNKGH